jgi:microcystin-dependent protein
MATVLLAAVSLAAGLAPSPASAARPTELLAHSNGAFAYQENSSSGLVNMSFSAIAPAGGDQPHNNLQPYLTLNFCIALQGVFPPRT